ncbi:unnamed protein product [Brassicogethes aeneus]|uniref:Uncharacterized protein n=1 Tax=Brassicogethes aeneus TaxID=1431903 RepID=A0A9P0ATG4_BRAAE|nr:unnamed protein product [Brassicogethes aeneus]
MTRFTLLNCAVIIATFIYLESVFCAPHFDSAIDKRKYDEKAPLWFGPRMGRRKRNPNESYYKYLETDEINSILDAIQESPYAIVVLNPAKRHTVNYQPRLGRDSGEENDEWLQEDLFEKRMNERSPPFAPRLGKRNAPMPQPMDREKYAL